MACPSKIGLLAPYTWNETTYMACGLADLAVRLGVSVSYLSQQPPDSEVHYRWDRLVLNGRRQSFEMWHNECSHLVWFDIQKSRLYEAHRSGKKNILVACWHQIAKEQLSLLPLFDAVVSPSVAACQRLTQLAPSAQHVCVPWDCGLPIVTSAMPGTGQNVLCVVGSRTASGAGPLILNTLRVLLDFDDEVRFTLMYSKGWGPAASQTLSELLRKHGERVRLLRRPSYASRVEAYNRHDWVFAPNLREESGWSALEALHCRRPVVVFDAAPSNELVQNGHNGLLIPCEISYNWLGATEVVVNAFDLTEQLRRLVDHPEEIIALTHKDWPELGHRRETFSRVWRSLWDFDEP